MIGAFSRAIDRFRGSGDAAVTIPSMDGAFRPNHMLETAAAVLEIDEPDNLVFDDRRVLFSSGPTLFEFMRGLSPQAKRIAEFEYAITAAHAHPSGTLAVGLASGEVVLRGGSGDGQRLTAFEGRPIRCPTALYFADAETLLVCLGSQKNDPTDWARDLLEGNSSGSVWRVDLTSREATCLADGLAWAGGVVAARQGSVAVAEAWRHQLVAIGGGAPQTILSEIPGYPARLAPAGDGGYWLSIFAPRSQLVEFVLREPDFRQRMMREIVPQFWVAPSLHHARDYREPLQAGAIKQLGELKPWAPSRSYGLVCGLDAEFVPIQSFHSRADGKRHGITSTVEADGRLFATSKGGNVILALDLARMEEPSA